MTAAWATIIGALVSATAAIVVGVFTSRAQHKAVLVELEKHDQLQAYRIEQLEAKVEKHNNMLERTYALERKTDVMDEKISVANHRIDDLEKKSDI